MVNCYERAKTPILITIIEKKISLKCTAEENSDEGGDHGKSSWPLRVGL
jgi:hypothetical protein